LLLFFLKYPFLMTTRGEYRKRVAYMHWRKVKRSRTSHTNEERCRQLMVEVK
jgi:hypothetical protein